mmetsp:Transcript_7187/g.21926  ORF Transcript_7187/g.21926 Transcript_7187/m.21926 type:complete len:145 (-) Transcript_7187:537-971(-)
MYLTAGTSAQLGRRRTPKSPSRRGLVGTDFRSVRGHFITALGPCPRNRSPRGSSLWIRTSKYPLLADGAASGLSRPPEGSVRPEATICSFNMEGSRAQLHGLDGHPVDDADLERVEKSHCDRPSLCSVVVTRVRLCPEEKHGCC